MFLINQKLHESQHGNVSRLFAEVIQSLGYAYQTVQTLSILISNRGCLSVLVFGVRKNGQT